MIETPIRKVNMSEYLLDPSRYQLRSGKEPNAPLCPYGNHYKWIGFDNLTNEYIRFTKSVFKHIIQQKNNTNAKSNME